MNLFKNLRFKILVYNSWSNTIDSYYMQLNDTRAWWTSCGLNFLPISSLCPRVPTISATLWPCELPHKRDLMVKSVEYLSILEIDLHIPPQVRLSDLCTLWCHGEYCVRLLFELKGKWCFDNLYISNWKVEMNNFWLFETPHWVLTKGSLIEYCSFIFDSYISSPCNFSPCCYIQI